MYFSPFCISGITTSDCTKMGLKMRECNALEARFGRPGMFTFPLKKRAKKLLCRNKFFAKSVTLVPLYTPCGFLDRIGVVWYNIGTQQNKNMQTQKSYCLTCVCIFIS